MALRNAPYNKNLISSQAGRAAVTVRHIRTEVVYA